MQSPGVKETVSESPDAGASEASLSQMHLMRSGIHKAVALCDSPDEPLRERRMQRLRMTLRHRPAIGSIAFLSVMLLLGLYFAFAAVQGDYGVFRRAELNAEADQLRTELATLSASVDRMENLTHRLSDAYLDLDLLDEQARDVLGLIRSDEIVIR
jgi:cell division protein FtsB